MTRLLFGLLACALWLFGFAARAEESAQVQADPALWGVYSQLVGTTRQAGERGYRVAWSWSRPGEEIVEQWLIPGSNKLSHSQTLKLGGQPGELILTTFGNGTWNGTIQPEGSILFTRDGLLKSSYHIGLAADGYLETRRVKLKDGQIVTMDAAPKHARFALVDASSSVMAAGLPAATATSQPDAAVGTVASAQSAPVDPHADPSIWGHYARIVGREWHGFYHVSVRWSTPGAEMVEVWKYGPMKPLAEGQTIRTITIRPDSKPGRLRAIVVGSDMAGEYRGKIAKSGRIGFDRHSVEMIGPNTVSHWGATVAGYGDHYVHAKSSDAAPQRSTWSTYMDLVGQSYKDGSRNVLLTHDWLIPGEVMYSLFHDLNHNFLYGEQIYVSPQDGGLVTRSAPPWTIHSSATVEADGKITITSKRTLGMRSQSTLKRLSNGHLELMRDHSLSSAETYVLAPVAAEQVQQLRLASLQREQERQRQEAIAKAERSERRAEMFNAIGGAMNTLSQELATNSAGAGGYNAGSTHAQIEAATDRMIDQLRMEQQRTAAVREAREAQSSQQSHVSASSAGSAAFVAGTYVMDGGSYSIKAELEGSDLVVTEPNKVSRYQRHSDGVWHFYNANTDTVYGLRVVDGRTLHAFKPHHPDVSPTRLSLVGGGAAVVAQVRTVNHDMNAIAEKYKQKSTQDPDNTQVWTACALAAHKRATATGAAADLYGSQMAQMLKGIMVDSSVTPCADAIPAVLW